MTNDLKTTDFIDLYDRKKQTVFSIVFMMFIFSLLFTFVQPLKYSTESSMMMVQSFNAGVDPYTVSKSNEYLSNVLSNVVLSGKFYDDVMASGFDIDQSYFKADPKKRMKNWTQTVSAKAVSDTGIINIGVYHVDKHQSSQIARAINFVLQTKHSDYHGSGSNVTIKIIDQPITSTLIAKPNIPLNLGLGLVLGFILGLYYIYLFPEERYDFKLFLKKKKKNNNKKKDDDMNGSGGARAELEIQSAAKVNYIKDDVQDFQGSMHHLFRHSS